jgi:hypothetical protein
MRTVISLIAALPLLAVSWPAACEVYRVVDEAGNVTFTDVPPESGDPAERVNLPPPPSQERLRQSEQRNRSILKAAEQARRAREEQRLEQKSRVAEARKKLTEAEAELAKAKVIQNEDRQHLAGGKRRVHPSYFERVKQAEAEV